MVGLFLNIVPNISHHCQNMNGFCHEWISALSALRLTVFCPAVVRPDCAPERIKVTTKSWSGQRVSLVIKMFGAEKQTLFHFGLQKKTCSWNQLGGIFVSWLQKLQLQYLRFVLCDLLLGLTFTLCLRNDNFEMIAKSVSAAAAPQLQLTFLGGKW